MKKICWLAALLFMVACVSPLYADEVDDALPVQTSEQLKTSTRAMIQAGIDKDDAIDMTGTMIKNRFRVETIVKAQKTIINAHQENLPVTPVMNKAYEGMSKKVNENNILNAMETTRNRYAHAYKYARQLSDDEAQIEKTGNLLAQGMAAGLSQEDAAGIMDQLQSQRRIRKLEHQELNELCDKTLELTRDMMRLGASSEDGALMVKDALQNQFNAQGMEKLQQKFMVQSRFQSPTDLAKQYQNQIQKGMDAESIGGSGDGNGSGGSENHSGAGGSAANGGSNSNAGESSGGNSGSSGAGGSDSSGSSSGASGSGSSGGSSGSSGNSGGSGGNSGSSGSGGGSGSSSGGSGSGGKK